MPGRLHYICGMDQILPTMLAVLGANLLTMSAIYGAYRLSKAKTDGDVKGDVVAAWLLPLLFIVLGLIYVT